MALRVAAFDLDGVLALPSLTGTLRRTEEALSLPRGFLIDVFQKESPEGPNEQLMRGKITFSQWAPLIEESCRKRASASGTSLPEDFSISQIFNQAMAARSINRPMLQAAIALRKKGFTTCIVTNNWLDDSDKRGSLAQMMCDLSQHFDFLIESCQVGLMKPEPQIYKFVLETLKAQPNEVVFLDDFGSNLKPAREMGMVTILVRDTDTALRELEKITGTQFPEAPLPVPCNPNDVSHGYVTVKPGSRLHFVEMGSGPAVCLCHGFPESWFSWRYQIPALAQAGFRVLALDMKGYGDSSSPPGGLTLGLCPCKEDVETLIITPTPMLNLQLEGVAEAELEKNMSRTFKTFFRASDELILVPALMVTAEKDIVLRPQMSKNMENWVREWPHNSGHQWPRKRAQVPRREAEEEDIPERLDRDQLKLCPDPASL
ncbi:Bifunctional epoxide hydrolase 2 [Microtus ochrogaster]|uniref:Bifunctional epoxide hydrolase 2 n=1 Tax=Microtus ochrogaster TaxID=79684 RepID=A0A8J6L8W0_MICOH|nr:Bifunctional epoxide hydrolase 2 [Microtus ochrogaster]